MTVMLFLWVITELSIPIRMERQRTQRCMRGPAHEDLAHLRYHVILLSTRKVQAHGHAKPQIRFEIELALWRLPDQASPGLRTSCQIRETVYGGPATPHYTARFRCIRIVDFDIDVRGNDLGFFGQIFLRNHAGASICEELIGLAGLGRGSKPHLNRDRAKVGVQAKWSFQAGLLITGKPKETDHGFVGGTGATVARVGHISVCLT